ncbi:dynein axonemal heavy chain 6-like [Tachypleus tridentatus]|uniref:dynein axonemal heavy chain 6-like n=1 Tax=Tachypleus tridentatus TaxID=6853 RepID=UPI003FD38695
MDARLSFIPYTQQAAGESNRYACYSTRRHTGHVTGSATTGFYVIMHYHLRIQDGLSKTCIEKTLLALEDTEEMLTGVPGAEKITTNELDILEAMPLIPEYRRYESLNVTRELYDLVDSYSVPVPPEDIAGYSALSGLLCHLQKAIKNESSERETYKTNLNTSLVKDIDELKQEVKDLKRDVECDFENINPEHLRTQTTEYLKTIHQIERGLPVNSVTLSLKEKVEEMKEKVSVITYLRSPAMKSHHWDLI